MANYKSSTLFNPNALIGCCCGIPWKAGHVDFFWNPPYTGTPSEGDPSRLVDLDKL